MRPSSAVHHNFVCISLVRSPCTLWCLQPTPFDRYLMHYLAFQLPVLKCVEAKESCATVWCPCPTSDDQAEAASNLLLPTCLHNRLLRLRERSCQLWSRQ